MVMEIGRMEMVGKVDGTGTIIGLYPLARNPMGQGKRRQHLLCRPETKITDNDGDNGDDGDEMTHG